MVDEDFPSVHFYDQDFVDLYDKIWVRIRDFWHEGNNKNRFAPQYFNHPENKYLSQVESCLATFFLAYSKGCYPAHSLLDTFYQKQEANGAIRAFYDVETGDPIFPKGNAEGICAPLFAIAEYNLYHKVGNKKRLKEVAPIIEKYFDWLCKVFRQKNGLFATPFSVSMMDNSPRKGAHYLIDFNAQMAVNALYLSAIGEILNDKEMAFKYKQLFFSLKTRINMKMWNEEDGFFFDLDKNEEPVRVMTIASYWVLLGEIPNEDRAKVIIDKLQDPNFFGTDHPFPSLAVCDKNFNEKGNGWHGSVYPCYVFVVIKGLEKYKKYEYARECAIRHLYFILDTFHMEEAGGGDFFEAYLPMQEGAAKRSGHPEFPRKNFIPYVGISAITLMVENILGLSISLPKKTVEWVLPTMEIIGIENLSLKRNKITILSNKSGRGWEIRLESDKLYYFTIRILDENKNKTLPIPSGKCSMLIDKL